MQSPGHIENIINIVDLSGIGISDTKAITTLAARMKDTIGVNYKAFGRAVYMLNSPKAFEMIWNTVQYFFDENSVRKISITSQNTCPMLPELCSLNQFEEKFGGTAKTRQVGEYWPPCLPDMNFNEETNVGENVVV